MSDFIIFKAAFNNSATPAIGTYTAEGATAQFTKNTSISPDYYLYNTVLYSAVQWFVPTAETTDFEFVADILTRSWDNRVTYFIIADSTGTTRLRMWSTRTNWHFENSDGTGTSGNPEYIGTINPTTSGGFGVFHQFRVRVRKLTASSSSVEVYVDGTLKLTATAGAALITCAKIGFVGGVNSFGPGTGAGIKNAYVYDLSDGDVVDRGVLSGAFNRFISWMKSKFALKSDIPTVNDATLTIQKNGTDVATFSANSSTNATANITVPTKTSDLTNDSGFITEDTTKIPLAGSNQISGDLIPATDNSIDIGSSTKNLKMLYTKGITINGTQFLPSDYIPISGGAVFSGSELSRIDTTGSFILRGGTNEENGSSIEFYGKDYSNSYFVGRCRITAYDGTTGCILNLRHNGEMYWSGTSVFPAGDNNCECGRPHNRWSVVYAASGTINTSDARLKNSVKNIDDKLLDAWGNIEPKQYKFNDATEKKGEKARLHTGYLAQDVQAECEKQGINASDYGLFCYDEWEEQKEVSEEVETEKDGKIIKEKHIIQPRREKGNSYSLRYEEALVVECMYLRRCIERLTARIEELEKGKEQEASK